ncbi:unnamed protein product [Anisakis simplex]|uniref:Uncharacterized protein n=1 Tax=Anisakis simplex TaxID=6269 RepID=A0A0M3JLP0_ANISI|nr:unnamed protein product [Anisakis simplex]
MDSLTALLPTDTILTSAHGNAIPTTSSCYASSSVATSTHLPMPSLIGSARVPALLPPHAMSDLSPTSGGIDRYPQFSEQYLQVIPEVSFMMLNHFFLLPIPSPSSVIC